MSCKGRKDPYLVGMVECLKNDILPSDDKADLADGVLHFENSAFPGSWCVVVPQGLRVTPMKEAHAGSYAVGIYNHWTGLD